MNAGTRRAAARAPLAAALAALALLACGSPQVAHAQGISNDAQNDFQCWPGVALSGVPIQQPFIAKNPDACSRKCTETSGCSMFTLSKALWCNLKSLPFDSLYGTTKRDDTVLTSCVYKPAGGTLPSPSNAMCYQGQDIQGHVIANTDSVHDPLSCARLCQSVPGCTFSVFRATGLNGSSAPLCQIKTAAFRGSEAPNVTRRDPLVTGLCLRAFPAPEIADPLLGVAGPIPFRIFATGTDRCLRAPSPPYTAGMFPYFSHACDGGESLWTYNSGTQILSHYISDLCLAPVNDESGSLMTLSETCGPASGNRVVSRGSGSLQVLAGPRWILPVGANPLVDGALSVAVTNGAEAYTFVPSPLRAYACYPEVDIPGHTLETIPHIVDAEGCADRCLRDAACAYFTYSDDGACHLRTEPFTDGAGAPAGAARAPHVDRTCLSLKFGSTETSPANYLCYGDQRASGTTVGEVERFSPQACTDLCSEKPECTFSYFWYPDPSPTNGGLCYLGRDVFHGAGPASDNRYDTSVEQLCLSAPGAPGNVASGYLCFDNVEINGGEVWRYLSVVSRDECTRRCEEKAELCTLAVYQPSAGLCILKNNAFGYGGSGSQAAGLSSCLRAASGGNLNSPANYLCYSYQTVAGRQLAVLTGVANTTACANSCTGYPGCAFAVYNPSDSARCTLKSEPFYGNEGNDGNREDWSSGVCFHAPGAPVVTSGFGNPGGPGLGGAQSGVNTTEMDVVGNSTDGGNSTGGGDATDATDATDGDDDDDFVIDWSGVGFGSAMPGK
uniref:Apple domain-containing protein n=1 Tax=Chlamydomonas euryale TaxID=1486919 RepID=A0A7R9VNV5_9CHLO|mmetsp:Transcript_40172/g.119714  ORF Transcript_40172/g.119714 Transcript_40172/m.119714 type:complete len:783 (+) Transcript_40172:385-2733(+)